MDWFKERYMIMAKVPVKIAMFHIRVLKFEVMHDLSFLLLQILGMVKDQVGKSFPTCLEDLASIPNA